ncbi:hypothetical protein HPB52_023614 [Rhipicephalus sanguineus]|uniref:Secreted protein n=2 Tax=Rhipicephalus sanguineus TaxID=34632 RepID=A0A9D4Q917_RHISA|nr:hypothetical protein HPB52_023614 [Rhipicephalus sanguineus]
MFAYARRGTMLWFSLALLACGVVPPQPSEAASLADRIFSGFLSFGRGFSNATQGFVVRVRGLVTRVAGSSATAGSSKGAAVRDIDIFASVCS